MQTLITALIVLASAAYALWSLMPSAWRRALAQRLGRTPTPASGCGGCGGCGGTVVPAVGQPVVKTITVHRRGQPPR